MGFTQAGFRCVAAFDKDARAVATHQKNLQSRSEIRDLASAPTGLDELKNVDVLLAGPPCQGFSTLGKRDIDDPRNELLPLAGQLALAISPKVIVIENVAGVLAGQHRRYWTELQQTLRVAGYQTAELSVNSADYGVPQKRKRTLLFAWQQNGEKTLTLPAQPISTLRDAIGDLECAENHFPKYLTPGSEPYLIAKNIGENQKLCNVRNGSRSIHTWDIPEVFGPVTKAERSVLETIMRLRRQLRDRDYGDADPVLASAISKHLSLPVQSTLDSLIRKGYVRKLNRRYDLTHTFNGKYRRLSWDEPSHTVDTRFNQARYYLHPQDQRGFTIREAARVQGFPDTFVFDGPEVEQIRLVGNAVPPPLARTIALVVRQALLET